MFPSKINALKFSIVLAAALSSLTASAEQPSLQQLINKAIEQKAAELTLPAGVYRLKAGGGGNKPVLSIDGARNLKINAEGVKIICTDMEDVIVLNNCQDLTLTGLSIDYDPLPFTQGKIIAMAPDTSWLDIQIDAGYPIFTESRMQFIHDGQTGYPKPGSTIKTKGTLSIQKERILRLSLPDAYRGCNAAIGDYVVLSNHRTSTAITVTRCARLTFQNVVIHSSPSMGIAETGEGASQLTGVKIIPGLPPAGAIAPRLRSTNADGLHFNGVIHGPLISDCHLARTGDDAINVHGNYGLAIRSQGKKVYIAEIKNSVIRLAKGDRLQRIGGVNCQVYGESVITEVRPVTQDADLIKAELAELLTKKSSMVSFIKTRLTELYELTLQENINIEPGDYLFSKDRCGEGAVIRKVKIENNYNRGIMLSTTNALVEDCVIDGSTFGGIAVTEEVRWMQGSFGRDIVIQNNTVRNVLFSVSGAGRNIAAAISVTGEGNNEVLASASGNRSIRILNNTVENCSGPGLMVTSSEDVEVKGNRFFKTNMQSNSNAGSKYGVKTDCAIWLDECKNVTFGNNTVVGQGPGGRRLVGSTPTAVDVKGLNEGVIVK